MRRLETGFLCEGTSDVSTLKILVERLLGEFGFEMSVVEELSNPTNGPISEKATKLRAKLFADAGIDIALFIADADKIGFSAKHERIKKWVTEATPFWAEHCIVGIPERNLEAWLLADQDTVKKMLKLDGGKSLPFASMKDPKERLIKLVAEFSDKFLLPAMFRVDIARKANLNTMRNNSNSFRAFSDELRNVLTLFA